MKKKIAVLVGALAIATMVGLGFSQSDQGASASDTGEVQLDKTNEVRDNNPSVDSSDWIGEERAKEIALGEFSGKVVEFELDEDDGRYLYEIEIKDGDKEAEFDIDAETGDILEMEIDEDDDDDDDDRYDD